LIELLRSRLMEGRHVNRLGHRRGRP
jgi:hypothetical protein